MLKLKVESLLAIEILLCIEEGEGSLSLADAKGNYRADTRCTLERSSGERLLKN